MPFSRKPRGPEWSALELTAVVYPKVVLRDGHPVVSGPSGFAGLNLSIGAVKKIATDAGGSWDDETIRLVEQLVRERAIDTTRSVVAYYLHLAQVARNKADRARSKRHEALAESVFRQWQLTFDDIAVCHRRAADYLRHGPHQFKGNGQVEYPPVEWSKPSSASNAERERVDEEPREATSKRHASAKGGSQQRTTTSGGWAASGDRKLSKLEQRSFNNSALSFPFWSDSIQHEDPMQIRRAAKQIVARQELFAEQIRQWTGWALALGAGALLMLFFTFAHGNKDVGQDTSDKYPQVVGLLVCTCVLGGLFRFAMNRKKSAQRSHVQASVSPDLRRNSKRRFAADMATLLRTDQARYWKNYNWFVAVAQYKEELERLRIEQEERWRIDWSSITIEPGGQYGRIGETTQPNTQTTSRQQFHQTDQQSYWSMPGNSGNQNQSNHTCTIPGCCNEGMNRFGNDRLCGLHTLHM